MQKHCQHPIYHQTEDDAEYPGPSTSAVNTMVPEKKPKLGRPKKEGGRGPGRPRKVRPEETQELKSAQSVTDSDEETETDEGDNYDSDTGVGPSPPPPQPDPQGARPTDFLVQGDRRDQTSTAQYNIHSHGGQMGGIRPPLPVPTMSQQPFCSGNTGMTMPSSAQQQGGQPQVSSGAYHLQGGPPLQPGMMMRPPLPQVTSAPLVTSASSHRAQQSESSTKQSETAQSNPPQHFTPQHFPPGFQVPSMPFQQYSGMMGGHGHHPQMGSGHFMPPHSMPGMPGFPPQFMPAQSHPGMMAPNMGMQGPMMSLLSDMRPPGPPPLVPIGSIQENQDNDMPLDMSINNKNRSQERTTTSTSPMVTLSQIPTPTWAPPSLPRPPHFKQGFPGAGLYSPREQVPNPGGPQGMPYFGSQGHMSDSSSVLSGRNNIKTVEQGTDKHAKSKSPQPKADEGDEFNRKKDSSSAYLPQDIKMSECDNKILNFTKINANRNNFAENGKHSDLTSGQRDSVIVKSKEIPGNNVNAEGRTVSYSGLPNFISRSNAKVDTHEDDDYDA
ncbi:basic salivary proline-rich protein 1-like isoform X2 [Mya arenaria]|uniref:basic salivary proline-rich protein 1-like isoform X2 n=1 Tax=Mya arenaria TaxID=6604 RepID=UPI0022E1BD08|nr:basic salivary proline-rich protein 1-like isoform X2 [Mya arenaria]